MIYDYNYNYGLAITTLDLQAQNKAEIGSLREVSEADAIEAVVSKLQDCL